MKGEFMKKMLTILMLLHGMAANAYEYSSDHQERENYQREREEWVESDSRRHEPKQRYGQNYQQPPIQIYLAPNQNSYSREWNHRNLRLQDKEYREELYWRERREELERQPQRPYRENSFYRDENHW